MAGERRLAVGVEYFGVADPGDGVMGTAFTECENIEEGTITLGFNDPTSVDFNSEQLDDPWESFDRKGDPDTIEAGIPSPTPEECALFMGGTVEEGKWNAPAGIPIIRKSLKFRTKPYKGSQTEYGIVNCKVFARLDRAPSKEQTDLLLIRFTKLAAVTAAGEAKSPFYREVKDVEAPTP